MIIWKLVTCQRMTSKKYLTSIGRHPSLRYRQVILVSGYPVLTAVSWSQHWCPICVHYQFSCAPTLARKYEIEYWLQSSKTIKWSADSFQINHITSMSWHMSLQYGHVILVSGYPLWQLSIDHIGQSAKTADWLVDNDVILPVLCNCACANPRKLKID